METKHNRDNNGKFQIKGNQYKSRVTRLTLDEYEQLQKWRLKTKEINIAVFSQSKEKKCYACQGKDSSNYISIHESCVNEFLIVKPKKDILPKSVDVLLFSLDVIMENTTMSNMETIEAVQDVLNLYKK